MGLEDPSIYPFMGLKKTLYDRNRNNIYPHDEGISCIAAGMNFAPVDKHTVQYENNLSTLDSYLKAWEPYIQRLDERKKEWDSISKNYSSYYEWLKNRFYENS